MKESGQIDRLWNRWKASPATGCLGDGAEPLEPKTLLADFIILGAAAVISVFLLLAELLFRLCFIVSKPHCLMCRRFRYRGAGTKSYLQGGWTASH